MNNEVKNFSFQGINGAYSELAGSKVFQSAQSVSCKTFEDMFESVKNNETECAMVPIENSSSGRVADTQRLIPNSNLNIIGEYFLNIDHCLLAPKGASINSLKRVRSHEQALAQCRKNLLTKNLSLFVVADTAGAAKEVAEINDKEEGAIASSLAAEIYSLDILENNIQDVKRNITRFLIMGKKSPSIDPDEEGIITTILFQVRSIPAALYKSLGGFATNGVNITKLESYIHPQGFDVAQFYIDFEGHPENAKVKLAIEDLKFYSKNLKILGVYKGAEFRKK